MQRIKYAFLSVFLIFQLLGSTQTNRFNDIYTPLSKEQQLDSLIMLHKQLNKMNGSIPGYRLQIYFESGNYSKSRAEEVKKAFELKNPDFKAYISFNEPYYRVRVGDFRHKIEAIGFLKKILRTYPTAYEVEDMISFNDNEKVITF